MMFFNSFIGFVLVMSAFCTDGIGAEPVSFQRLVDEKLWITEHYPPYHYVTNNEIDGIAIEILSEIFQRNNVVFNPKEKFMVFPWARAVRELEINHDAAIVSMGFTEERSSLFRLSKPLFSEEISLITLKRNQKSRLDLSELFIGVVRDDIGEKLLLSSNAAQLNLAYVQTSEELLLMLLKERVDAVAYSKQIIDYQISKLSVPVDEFSVVKVLAEVPATIAFNLNGETALLQLINETIEKMHQDGSIERIFEEYRTRSQKQ